jgi:enamine deaminase RidA (YjgF/YER057c/UK114 family)
MSGLIEGRLADLKIELPPPPPGVGAYVPVIEVGPWIVTSGQLPWLGKQLAFTGPVGGRLTVQDGYESARLCAINAIAQLKSAVYDLDRIRQIFRVEGYVYSAPGFRDQPKVLNGASDLLVDVFGERGKHTRTALGISEMPLDAPVQLVVWAQTED